MVCQFGIWVFFSIPMSFLFMAILVVICLSAEKKMVWVDANAYVAMMKNAHAEWNMPPVNYPGGSVATNLLIPTSLSFLAREKNSISLPAGWSIPKPTARVWFRYNKLHEIFFHRTSESGTFNPQFGSTQFNCIKISMQQFSKNLSGGIWIKLANNVVLFFSPRPARVKHFSFPFSLYPIGLICTVGRFLRRFVAESIRIHNVYTLGEVV